jgi:hypothetical protein
MLFGCSRSYVPVSSISTGIPSTAVATPTQPILTPTAEEQFQGPLFSVVWVTEDETLVIRKPAGISGANVGELVFDQGGIELTGASSLLGSSTWMEIRLPDGGTGWVNRWNITESVAPEFFCNDERIPEILNAFTQVVVEQDGARLTELVNPQRGLILRHDWWNPEILFPIGTVGNVYTNLSSLTWGKISGTEFPIEGSFSEVIAPQLSDVFEIAPSAACNELLSGVTTREIVWPDEYHNINFYSFYRPAPEGGNAFDWRGWALGFEYIQGQPYLTILVQFRGDI